MSAEAAPEFDRVKSLTAVKYEYDMAHATAALLLEKWEPAAVEFALIESFLVHARNLHDFCLPRTTDRREWDSDIRAYDFTDDFGVETFDIDTIETINRWLHHITTWRHGSEHPGWFPFPMMLAIHESMNTFLETLHDVELVGILAVTHSSVAKTIRPDPVTD